MTMRWVLTWKTEDDGTQKAKARLVVKGFTDPDLVTLRSESPTLSRLGKHWFLQRNHYVSSLRFHVQIGVHFNT